MKPYTFFLSIALVCISIISCNKKGADCGCVEPPLEPTNWKITGINGGINGDNKPLTTDQQNNVLTMKPNGQFVCTNKQTGMIVNGIYTMSDFASIYGTKTKIVFNPQLPMLDNEFYILLGYPERTMVLADNAHDGYTTTFSLIQP